MAENKQRILAAYDTAAKSGPGPKTVLISDIPGHSPTIITANNNNIMSDGSSDAGSPRGTEKETIIILDVIQDSVQTNF